LIVVDCSVFVALLLTKDAAPDEVLALQSGGTAVVPEYLAIEFLNATRRLANSGHLDEVDALARQDSLERFPKNVFDTYGLAADVLRLRNNFSAYDAGYVALAGILEIPLMTFDLRLRKAVSAHTKVRLI
jgi:predicted nucleic acid-binding protein